MSSKASLLNRNLSYIWPATRTVKFSSAFRYHRHLLGGKVLHTTFLPALTSVSIIACCNSSMCLLSRSCVKSFSTKKRSLHHNATTHSMSRIALGCTEREGTSNALAQTRAQELLVPVGLQRCSFLPPRTNTPSPHTTPSLTHSCISLRAQFFNHILLLLLLFHVPNHTNGKHHGRFLEAVTTKKKELLLSRPQFPQTTQHNRFHDTCDWRTQTQHNPGLTHTEIMHKNHQAVTGRCKGVHLTTNPSLDFALTAASPAASRLAVAAPSTGRLLGTPNGFTRWFCGWAPPSTLGNQNNPNTRTHAATAPQTGQQVHTHTCRHPTTPPP